MNPVLAQHGEDPSRHPQKFEKSWDSMLINAWTVARQPKYSLATVKMFSKLFYCNWTSRFRGVIFSEWVRSLGLYVFSSISQAWLSALGSIPGSCRQWERLFPDERDMGQVVPLEIPLEVGCFSPAKWTWQSVFLIWPCTRFIPGRN